MNQSAEINELAGALALAQAKMENPGFDRENPHFRNKYATLAAIRNAVVPPLAAQGIAVLQSVATTEDGVACITRLMHKSGQWWESDPFTVPVSKQDAQAVVGARTYACRISLQTVVVVSGEDDDDGNAAASAPPVRESRPAHVDTDGVVRLPGKPTAFQGNGGKPLTEIPTEALTGIAKWFKNKGEARDAALIEAMEAELERRRLEPAAPDFSKEPPALATAKEDDDVLRF